MKRHVKERIARNRELGALDAANRCWQCKRAFTETGMIVGRSGASRGHDEETRD